jgi:hypothetical protein
MRILCIVGFKLNVINRTKELGNTAAVRYFELPPTKKIIHKWRRHEKKLLESKKLKSFYTHTTKWPNIKMEIKNCVTDQRHKEYCVSKQ